ncbi:MAG: DUF72 domain-containing protein [Bacteroidia bacterium]|nr:DUF72 domain-containing protein [Bacteroidia bacterium]
MNKTYHIGCSGYYYPSWKHNFYPSGLAPKNWLNYYSSVFNAVELNGTFYQTPKLKDLKKYADETPAEFRFSVKMSRYITHVKKMSDTKDEILELQNLFLEGLQNKLACFLFQLPPSFVYNENHLDRLLKNIPHQPRNAVELRDLSWWNANVEDAFRKTKLTFCNIEHPKLQPASENLIHTSDCFYMRFHGTPELFKSKYDITRLTGLSKRFPKNSSNNYIFFNNTYYDAAYRNAKELKTILQK